MWKKFTSLLLLSVICVSTWYASVADYKNSDSIAEYKTYLEKRADALLSDKLLWEKIDILVKIKSLLQAYEEQSDISDMDIKKINFLYALQAYIQEDMGMKTGITVRIIDDARCQDCMTDEMTQQLQALPFLKEASFTVEDFSDTGTKQYMKENGITHLPAFIFDTNEIEDDNQIVPYLWKLPDGNYSLAAGANFDPFTERSERGFKMISQDVIDELLEWAHLYEGKKAEILWIEYSDMECPFCARLHNDEVFEKLMKEYWDTLSYSMQHFPLAFHTNALDAAQALECIAEREKSAYYPVIKQSFETYSSNNFSLSGLYEIAESQGIEKKDVQECVNNNTYKQKVEDQMLRWQTLFGITGTPGNVLINTKTGEYTTISGAYPYEYFKEVIDSLSK